MKKFITTTYRITSEKIKKRPLKFVMISDLHNVVFNDHNEVVFAKIKEINPDAVLIAGDLVLGKPGASLEPALHFLRETVKLAPIIYAPGNHEHRMKLYPDIYGSGFGQFEEAMKTMGVVYLENSSTSISIEDESVTIFGLDLPSGYYKKGRRTPPNRRVLTDLLGKPEENSYNIVLAHTPRFGKSYFAWGGDLILSGHYHGGIIRLPYFGGIVSPDFCLFPRFCHGLFQCEQQYMITGAGMGEHTIPIRIHNPREMVVIHCQPKEV